MDYCDIKKVHVVFKTHLDIGYTDFAQAVLQRYLTEYIPVSLRLAMQLNRPDRKKFIWTVSSFLIDFYYKNAAPEERALLEEAIRLGYIAWHGLAMTTHSELMDQDLLRYNLGISRRLDRQFGKTTIAAKMTDVPGHTISMLPELAENGISYLHIGVNGASMMPQVPELCVWRSGEHEILLHYSADYGAPLQLEGFDEALEILHTGDNRGPQSAQEIEAQLKQLEQKYPNARVEASTLDAYAATLTRLRGRLPVLTQEIGDTWIYGAGTDPYKVACYRELLRLKTEWKQTDVLREATPGYDAFMTNLLLVPEHTWGKDFKTYLADYQNWSKDAFRSAREQDLFDCADNNPLYRHIHEGVTSYRDFEASHEEQRAYLRHAVEALPAPLQQQAQNRLAALLPAPAAPGSERQIAPGETAALGAWRVRVGRCGALEYLERDGRVLLQHGEIGRMQYQIFDAQAVNAFYYWYSRQLKYTEFWCYPDFAKPGLQLLEDLKSAVYDFYPVSIIADVQDNRLTVLLHGDETACETYGCPRVVRLHYVFHDTCAVLTADCLQKDASRIPEGLWLHIRPDVANPNLWQMQKLGRPVSPLSVVRGGNRKMHAVEKLMYHEAGQHLEIENLDSPLCCIGAMGLYPTDSDFAPLENGFYYNLYNNCWGTNFKMWYEEDIRSRFVIRLD